MQLHVGRVLLIFLLLLRAVILLGHSFVFLALVTLLALLALLALCEDTILAPLLLFLHPLHLRRFSFLSRQIFGQCFRAHLQRHRFEPQRYLRLSSLGLSVQLGRRQQFMQFQFFPVAVFVFEKPKRIVVFVHGRHVPQHDPVDVFMAAGLQMPHPRAFRAHSLFRWGVVGALRHCLFHPFLDSFFFSFKFFSLFFFPFQFFLVLGFLFFCLSFATLLLFLGTFLLLSAHLVLLLAAFPGSLCPSFFFGVHSFLSFLRFLYLFLLFFDSQLIFHHDHVFVHWTRTSRATGRVVLFVRRQIVRVDLLHFVGDVLFGQFTVSHHFNQQIGQVQTVATGVVGPFDRGQHGAQPLQYGVGAVGSDGVVQHPGHAVGGRWFCRGHRFRAVAPSAKEGGVPSRGVGQAIHMKGGHVVGVFQRATDFWVGVPHSAVDGAHARRVNGGEGKNGVPGTGALAV